jgi:hypothetical protein
MPEGADANEKTFRRRGHRFGELFMNGYRAIHEKSFEPSIEQV